MEELGDERSIGKGGVLLPLKLSAMELRDDVTNAKISDWLLQLFVIPKAIDLVKV